MRRFAVKTHRPALRAIVALGPNGGSSPARVTMRNFEASVALILTDHFPTVIPCATHGIIGLPRA